MKSGGVKEDKGTIWQVHREIELREDKGLADRTAQVDHAECCARGLVVSIEMGRSPEVNCRARCGHAHTSTIRIWRDEEGAHQAIHRSPVPVASITQGTRELAPRLGEHAALLMCAPRPTIRLARHM